MHVEGVRMNCSLSLTWTFRFAPIFRCMYCADYYWNKMELTHHRNLHTDVAYKCERCDLTFYNRDTMYSHCSLQHSKKYQNREPEEYICDLCAKQFKTKAGVRSHLFLHMSKFGILLCVLMFLSAGSSSVKEVKNSPFYLYLRWISREIWSCLWDMRLEICVQRQLKRAFSEYACNRKTIQV